MATDVSVPFQEIYSQIKEILLTSRKQAYSAVNSALVQAYWNVGRVIVEHEQNGRLRSEYGKGVLQEVSDNCNVSLATAFPCEIFNR